MSVPCEIRFVNEDQTREVTVSRTRHGSPEHVVSNLKYLKRLQNQLDPPYDPGEIAAQFVFIDKLWYIRNMANIDGLEDLIHDLFTDPVQAGKEFDDCIPIHKIGELDPLGEWWAYRVIVSDAIDWEISITKFEGDHQADVTDSEWSFSGSLESASDQIFG